MHPTRAASVRLLVCMDSGIHVLSRAALQALVAVAAADLVSHAEKPTFFVVCSGKDWLAHRPHGQAELVFIPQMIITKVDYCDGFDCCFFTRALGGGAFKIPTLRSLLRNSNSEGLDILKKLPERL